MIIVGFREVTPSTTRAMARAVTTRFAQRSQSGASHSGGLGAAPKLATTQTRVAKAYIENSAMKPRSPTTPTIARRNGEPEITK